VISSYKLPFYFDPTPLKADLDQIAAGDWAAHFNKGYFAGEWTGVALRSVDGRVAQLYPDPHSHDAVTDTPLLDLLPNFRHLLAGFNCPIRSARLLKLGPGSIIKEHRDYDLGYQEGEIRLHVPVSTNRAVEFFLDGHRVEMAEGECWYLDFSLPHRVTNGGPSDRIHLVVDCELNDWLRELLPAQTIELPVVRQSSPAEFEQFRARVLRDPTLLNRLRQVDDHESFLRLVVQAGTETGYLFAAADVDEAIQAERHAWRQRWLD
jgi:aspartyl/asparaginyl beta-hydroxylase